MHESSYHIMRHMLARVEQLSGRSAGGLCYDIGSKDINGNYRSLVESFGYRYLGVDAIAGPNVDLVCRAADLLYPFASNGPTIIISGQMLEHDRNPWGSVERLKLILEPGGWLCLIAPSEQRVHHEPVDCWRILPDGMRALLLGLDEIAVGSGPMVGAEGVDCWGMGRKHG